MHVQLAHIRGRLHPLTCSRHEGLHGLSRRARWRAARFLLLPPGLPPPSHPTRAATCRPRCPTGHNSGWFRGRRSLARVHAWACADVRRVGCSSSCHHQLSHVHRLGRAPGSCSTDPSRRIGIALTGRTGCSVLRCVDLTKVSHLHRCVQASL